MVGFQTGISHTEQISIFKQLPAFKNAVFVRLGQIHQNRFLPGVVNKFFQSRTNRLWFYAGQFTGTEGYLEAIAGGLWAGINVARLLGGEKLIPLPEESMLGGWLPILNNLYPKSNSQWGELGTCPAG